MEAEVGVLVQEYLVQKKTINDSPRKLRVQGYLLQIF